MHKANTELERENIQVKRDIENVMRRNLEMSRKEKQHSLNKSRGSPDSKLEFLLLNYC